LLRLVSAGRAHGLPVWVAVDPGLVAAERVISLAGGISFGLAWGWLLAERLRSDTRLLPAAGIAGFATAAPAGEAAVLAGGVAALALAAATCVGALLRTGFGLAIRRRSR
jgi:hypothetical protein